MGFVLEEREGWVLSFKEAATITDQRPSNSTTWCYWMVSDIIFANLLLFLMSCSLIFDHR